MIVAIGAALLGAVSGSLGTYAVLRRQSLLGDAISHAALPGVAIAFLLTGSKTPLILVLGAALAGWLGTLLILSIVRLTRIKYDSALGIVLSTFFGFGLVLHTLIQRTGNANQAGLDTFLFGQAATVLESDVLTIGILGGVAIIIMFVFWKELKLLVFDEGFAASLGFPIRVLDILLTSLLVIAIVLGLQAVGAVLMSAMLVAPAVAARQWTNKLSLMMFLAACFGALAGRTKLVKEDAAIGLTFPALFSIGVILISKFAGSVHLDMDAVLLGELAYAHLNRLEVFGYNLGPVSLYVMGTILLLNLAFILLFYKELKLATFDASLAAALGFAPTLIHYGLMTLVSVTTVGAFDAVGSILVVALIAGPPATAYLITNRLSVMLTLSAVIGSVNAVSGYWVAYLFDVSIAGSIATMTLLVFGLVFLVVPSRGLIAIARRRTRQKWEFAQTMLVIHLFNHEGLPEAEAESEIAHLHEHLRWDPEFATHVVKYALNNRCVSQEETLLTLTEHGRAVAQQALVQ
ncbi:Zinc transport system membrane protein TroD [Geodia barretti]|uniref:Zinc transport system membrane protein TroD n=1 Tax=Geodia barretti TaxID=519541 RepID=A0AA35SGQ0_GEOBA|nr:Zinc transport system membrane protein TroD [Geodia barretti]